MAGEKGEVVITEKVEGNRLFLVANTGTRQIGSLEAEIEGGMLKNISSRISEIGILRVEGFSGGLPLSSAFAKILEQFAERHNLRLQPPKERRRQGPKNRRRLM